MDWIYLFISRLQKTPKACASHLVGFEWLLNQSFVGKEMDSISSTISSSACAADVFAEGHLLCLPTVSMCSMKPEELDGLCVMLNEAANARSLSLRFDWHFQGGRPMILYSGDYEQAVELCYDVRADIVSLVRDASADESQPPLAFVGVNRRSTGQVLNKEP